MKDLIRSLESVGVKFEKGLCERDFKRIKEIYGITFPEVWKRFYKAGLPVSIKKDEKKLSSPMPFPIWNDYSEENVERIKTKMKKPYEWLKSDVLTSFDSNKPFWLKDWGTLPETKEEAAIRFDELIKTAPVLIPVYSHRYVPMLENIIDPPVISTVGIDTIMYGKNQFDYLQNEFIKPQIDPIPFWNGIILK
ncbi:MAG: hypothetical protein J6L23_05950 [Clostridia bacterium]|nr:hypothetical protein [Clostridia bacterium]